MLEYIEENLNESLPLEKLAKVSTPIELVQLEPIEGALEIECKIQAICLAIEPK